MTGLQLKYFVLKPAGDDRYATASRAALRTYANYMVEENPELFEDLRRWADEEAVNAIDRATKREEDKFL